MLLLRLRVQKTLERLKWGWHEVPHYYFAIVGLWGCIVVPRFIYKTFIKPPPEISPYFIRYKKRYLVVRPDDSRLKRYPREYITDVDVIKNYEQRH